MGEMNIAHKNNKGNKLEIVGETQSDEEVWE